MVINGFGEYRKSGENHVVETDEPVVPDCLSALARVELEQDLNHSHDEVFVEEIVDHLGDADVVDSAVDQQQFGQQLELADCEVTDLNGPHPLVPENTDSDIRLLNHVAVVRPVPDCQSYLLGFRSDKSHHLGFLLRSRSTANH